jgi:hypothetical protein
MIGAIGTIGSSDGCPSVAAGDVTPQQARTFSCTVLL